MPENIVPLDLTRFSKLDLQKIEALKQKVWMMRRWCRVDRITRDGKEHLLLYSGDRGPQPYASYRLSREGSGKYVLFDGRSSAIIATERTVDDVIDAIPDEFYYTRH